MIDNIEAAGTPLKLRISTAIALMTELRGMSVAELTAEVPRLDIEKILAGQVSDIDLDDLKYLYDFVGTYVDAPLFRNHPIGDDTKKMNSTCGTRPSERFELQKKPSNISGRTGLLSSLPTMARPHFGKTSSAGRHRTSRRIARISLIGQPILHSRRRRCLGIMD